MDVRGGQGAQSSLEMLPVPERYRWAPPAARALGSGRSQLPPLTLEESGPGVAIVAALTGVQVRALRVTGNVLRMTYPLSEPGLPS